jgi:DnaJ-domain-containing protein 1
VLRDGFGLFGGDTGEETAHEARPQRPIRNAERKCLRSLGLDETATRDDIKASFKALVKLHHPDSNGGDRRTEDKLRDVIQAYNYLKQAGLC